MKYFYLKLLIKSCIIITIGKGAENMILRKPYAFLIKHFKLIHLLLCILSVYLLLKTGQAIAFLSNGMSSTLMAVNIINTITTPLLFSIIIISIIFTIVLLVIMIIKQKPYIFYIINLCNYFSILILFIVTNNDINALRAGTATNITLGLTADLLSFSIIVQAVCAIFVFIRMTGFDIKKFSFGEDLEQLNINEKDREEFEVSITFDFQSYKRAFNEKIKQTKYFYAENKFVINCVIGFVILVLGISIYFMNFIKNKNYSQHQIFNFDGLTFNIENSYITQNNYQGNKITNNKILILEIKVKNNTNMNKTINTGKLVIKSGNNYYGQTQKYVNSVLDLGEVYNEENISTEYQKYILLYEVPSGNYQLSVNKGTNYSNKDDYMNIAIDPIDLDKKNKLIQKTLPTKVELNDSVLGDSVLQINTIDINSKFKVDYNTCNNNQCTSYYEYIRPVLNSNYDKTLIRINGKADIDDSIFTQGINNLYQLLQYYGIIKYKVDGISYYSKVPISNVQPQNVVLQDTYFIETDKNIENASSVQLILNIRNQEYVYNLK